MKARQWVLVIVLMTAGGLSLFVGIKSNSDNKFPSNDSTSLVFENGKGSVVFHDEKQAKEAQTTLAPLPQGEAYPKAIGNNSRVIANPLYKARIREPADPSQRNVLVQNKEEEIRTISSSSPSVSNSTIFATDFENESWFKDFQIHPLSPVQWGLDRCSRVFDQEKNSHVLQVLYLKGEIGPKNGGAYWRMYLPNKYEKLTLSYDVKFGKDFDFVLGGKLPGLAGGGTKEDPKNPVATYGKPDGTEGWSMRVMWKEEGKGINYVYHAEQPGVYGHSLRWGQRQENGAFDEVKFVPGKWHHVELEVTLNDPTKANGRMRSWLDGVLILDFQKVRNRVVQGLEIDSLYFDTYFGGPDHTWAPKKDEYIFFDNVQIKTN